MTVTPFTIRSFPRAIIHIDADSFFASCEQALHPEYHGKPLITGQERGIASAVSVEAKQLGVARGMSIRDIRRICPGIIYVPSDYETYSIFSKRMFGIVRRYTSLVEEYSIDECFAELTGLRRPLRMGYEDMVRNIKNDLESELGITFSIGLAPTKVLAKIGSKCNKPSGVTLTPGHSIHHLLRTIPVGDVWGIGPQTTKHLAQYGITTALEFAQRDEAWVRNTVTKPHVELWHELRGTSVLELATEEKHTYQSISKTKTFTPSTSDPAYLLAQLSKNVENACIKARRHHLAARRLVTLLKTQDHRYYGYEITLSRASNLPGGIMQEIRSNFDRVYRTHTQYRATGVVLADLISDTTRQADLFGASIQSENVRVVYDVVDRLDRTYGKHTIFLGSSLTALHSSQHTNSRAEQATRKTDLFKGETARKRVGIPMLGEVG